MGVKILADSACDLPGELLLRHDITLLPITIRRGDRLHRDGVDITLRDVFAQADSGGPLCATAAPNTDELVQAFQHWRGSHQEVIYVTISAEMSSEWQNACRAAQEVDGVHVVDSRGLSSAEGLVAMEAARLAACGLPAAVCAEQAREFARHVQSSFIMERLDYMRRGGRCSSVEALGANLLGLKPCIEVRAGRMEVVKRYRGSFARCMAQYTRELLDSHPGHGTAIVVHPDAGREAVDVALRLLRDSGRFQEVWETRTGCAVACHCGPDTVGVMFPEG